MAKICVLIALFALVVVSLAADPAPEVKKAQGGTDLKTASSFGYGLGFGYGGYGYGGFGGWGWGLPAYGWGGWGWGGPFGFYG